MSNTIIVATFDNTNAAYDAAGDLKKLMDQKIVDFKPKAGVMIKKDEPVDDIVARGGGQVRRQAA